MGWKYRACGRPSKARYFRLLENSRQAESTVTNFEGTMFLVQPLAMGPPGSSS